MELTRVMDCPRQTEGWTNYVITIGPDGQMSSLRQLLHADNIARVTPGPTTQQVHDILGRPAQQKRYELKNEEVWGWRFKQDGQESKLLSVTFDAGGRVTATAIGDDPRETAQGGK